MLKTFTAGLVTAAFAVAATALQTSPAAAGCDRWARDGNDQWRTACSATMSKRRLRLHPDGTRTIETLTYEGWGEWGYVDGSLLGIKMLRDVRLQGDNGSVVFSDYRARNRSVPRAVDGNLTWSGTGRGVYDAEGSWNRTGQDNDADQEFRATVDLTLSLDRLDRRRRPAPFLDIEFSNVTEYGDTSAAHDLATEIADKFSIDNVPFRNGRFSQRVQWNGGTTAEVRFYGRKHSYAAGYVRPYKYLGWAVRNQGEAIFVTSRDKQ